MGPHSATDTRRVRQLALVARALDRSEGLDAMVELAAEQVRSATGAHAATVSRLSEDRRELRVHLNAGLLAPGEERWPTDEAYAVADYPRLQRLLEDHLPYACSAADPDADPREAALLRELGWTSSLATPLFVDGALWGELWAARAGEPFDAVDDTAFLEALGAILGGAVSRALHTEALERLAFTDPLTGLANRRALDDAAHRALSAAARRGTGWLSAVAVDVDGLKRVNDERGHAEGDQLLLAVAQLLREAAAGAAGRPADGLAARTGGDEFVLLLTGAGAAPQEAAAAAERLRAAGRGLPHGALLSCGVASAGAGGSATPHDLLQAADAAQVRAKRDGGDRVVVAAALA